MPIIENYTSCSVKNLDKMGRPGRRSCRKVKLLTIGKTKKLRLFISHFKYILHSIILLLCLNTGHDCV